MDNWNPTPEEIAFYKKLAGDNKNDDSYYEMMLPLTLESLNEQLCQTFYYGDLPASIKLYLAKAVNFYGCDQTLKSRSMGSVSYSFDRSALPASIAGLVKKYNKCSGGRFVVFR